MPASSLLALIDDIASILDDVSAMTKVAAKKTAGVLGDDLALNAEQVTGVNADRELPVVWAVARGSFINKAILVPAALAISAFAPALIVPLLMIGGAFLCYEGIEKLLHPLLHGPEEEASAQAELRQALADPAVDIVAHEQTKIRGAIRTDFILSAEIIVISLGTISNAVFSKQVVTLTVISVLFTVGVYGLVAGIVKMDDAGVLLRKRGGIASALGGLLLGAAPLLMRLLSVLGTAAMFLVGGGIIAHGWHPLEAMIERITTSLAAGGPLGSVLAATIPPTLNGLAGIIVGLVIFGIISLLGRLRRR
jgi:predicted DNA repair protein MutK